VQFDSQGREVFSRRHTKGQFEAVFTVHNPIPEKFSK
jgi:1,2-phenylacetyl-CoA epoxidase PaaB subunit